MMLAKYTIICLSVDTFWSLVVKSLITSQTESKHCLSNTVDAAS